MTEPATPIQARNIRHAGPFRIEIRDQMEDLFIYDRFLASWSRGYRDKERDSYMKELAKALAFLDGTFDVIGTGPR